MCLFHSIESHWKGQSVKLLSFGYSIKVMILIDNAKIQRKKQYKSKKVVEEGEKFVSGKTMMPKEVWEETAFEHIFDGA